LDVLGGAALGFAAGGLVHLLLGAPEQRPSAGRVAAELRASGLDPDGLRPVGQNRRRSSSFVTDGGLFVKVVPSEWRDGDLLYRAWRRLLRRPRPPGFASALHEVEHEAAMALLAAAHGVRVPAVLLLRAFGNGAGLLVQRRVPGRPLADLGGQVGDELLRELWGQVGRLHAAGIAHGELDAGNVVVDDDGQPWLVDFGSASVGGERQRARDVADLLAALGPLVGPERAAAAARAAVGRDAVERAGPPAGADRAASGR
jgi:undecaprenyl-diphosphatase